MVRVNFCLQNICNRLNVPFKVHYINTVLFLSFLLFPSSSFAIIINGDFQTGNFQNWTMQEDYSGVINSPLIDCIDIGTGEYVGTLNTGYTDYGTYVTTLLQNSLTISSQALELIFDYRITDMGADPGGGGDGFLDQLSVSLLTDSGNIDPLMAADIDGMTLASFVSRTEVLGNGFTRIITDISSFAGAQNTSVIFDLYDEDDGRLTRVDIDNVSIVVPEPSSIIFLLAGTFIYANKRRKSVYI